MGKRKRQRPQNFSPTEQGKIAIPLENPVLLANPLPVGIQLISHEYEDADQAIHFFSEKCNRCLLEKWWVDSQNSVNQSEPITVKAPEKALNETKKIEIPWNAVISLPKPGGTEAVPDSAFPFYIIAKDGLYQHIRSILGRAVTKRKTFPEHLPEMKDSGEFTFEAPKIPATICAQIVDFFQRVWDTHKTEAEVILLMNRDTKEWSVMVPTQKTSHSAVDSRVDPERIPNGWLVVGSMHSHCNFTAFHSGTDKGDAEEMNGLHFTIGYLDKEVPQIVAMIAWNGIMFNYKPEELADFSDLNAAEAPAEWDNYVIPTAGLVSGHKPVGYDLFEKYPKVEKWTPPNTPYPYSQPTGYGPNYQAVRQAQGYDPQFGWRGNPGSWRDEQKAPRPKDLIWDEKHWNKYNEDADYYRWLSDHANEGVSNNRDWLEYTDSTLWDWSEVIDDNLVELLINSGLLTDDDMEMAALNKLESSHPLYWTQLMVRKFGTLTVLLKALNINVEYKLHVVENKKSVTLSSANTK